VSEKRLHAVVRGTVQGVGFRATASYEARKLRLGGWVRNLVDGAVEVEAQGEERALEEFVAFLHRGPLGAHVDTVAVEWLAAQTPARETFEVRRTS
jgi:acylphosphatase